MQVNMDQWLDLKPNAWLIGTASKCKYKYYALDFLHYKHMTENIQVTLVNGGDVVEYFKVHKANA